MRLPIPLSGEINHSPQIKPREFVMNHVTNALLVCSLVLLSGCWKGTLKDHTAVGWGGRAVAVTIDKSNEKHLLAASPTGGLFRSGIAGAVWGHCDSFPEFNCHSVKFCPFRPDIVVATCIEDTKATCGGGIWVSRDGGNSWTHPPSSIPLDQSGSPIRLSAFGIAFRADPMTIFVGTSAGLAVSQDLGQTWHFISGDVVGNTRIFSVLALNNGKVVTSGENGLHISDDGATGWYQDDSKLPKFGLFAYSELLAASPLNDDHLFYVNGNGRKRLHYSLDGGKNWLPAPADLSGIGAKYSGSWGAYVKVVRSSSGTPAELDLYYATGGIVGKSTLAWSGSDFTFSDWTPVGIAHSDNHDLAFSADGQTLYAANDGGLEKSANNGATWQHCGYAENGYDAMQVYDATYVLSEKQFTQNHLYFGTQDTNLYGSGDDGNTWPDSQLAIPEGGNIQGPVTQFSDYVVCYLTNQGNKKSDALFQNSSFLDFPFSISTLVYYVRNKTFAAFASDDDTGLEKLFASSDDGNVTWTDDPILSVNQLISQHIKMSGPADNPSMIAPFDSGNGLGLLRIDNAFDGTSGNETIQPIALPTGCTLGTYGAQYVAPLVSFGVDPADPNFIIIPDVGNGTMWITDNGGTTWTPRDDLLNLITDNGAYNFSLSSQIRSWLEMQNSQVSSITFDPRSSKRILIGTAEAGVVYSPDHGATWKKIDGSERIPYVTSFAFNQTIPGEAKVSSYGRGLWTVSLDITAQRPDGSGPRPSPNPRPRPNPRPSPQMLISKTAGDKDHAEKLYYNTNTPSAYIANGPNGSRHSIIAGSSPKVLSRKWPMKNGETNSIDFTLDGISVPASNFVLTATGTFKADLPPVSSLGGHQIIITELNPIVQTIPPTNRLILNFNALPFDEDEVEDPKH
jgi:photosystem II stability/assembly factor-like uncharacterized protein